MANSYMGLTPAQGLGNLLTAILGKPSDDARRLQSTAYAANVRSEMDKRDQEVATLLMDRNGREAAARAAMDPSLSPEQRSAIFTAAGWRAKDAGYAGHVPGLVLGQYAAGPNVDETKLSYLVAGAGHPFTSSPVGQQRHEGAETGRTAMTNATTLEAARIRGEYDLARPHNIGNVAIDGRGNVLYTGEYDLAPGHERRGPDNQFIARGQTTAGPGQIVYSGDGRPIAVGSQQVQEGHTLILPPAVAVPDESPSLTITPGQDGQPSTIYGGPRSRAGQPQKPLTPPELEAFRRNLYATVPSGTEIPPEAVSAYTERVGLYYGHPGSPTYRDAGASAAQARRDIFGDKLDINKPWFFGSNSVVPRETASPPSFSPGQAQPTQAAPGRPTALPMAKTDPGVPDQPAPGPGGTVAPSKLPFDSETMIQGAREGMKRGTRSPEEIRSRLEVSGLPIPEDLTTQFTDPAGYLGASGADPEYLAQVRTQTVLDQVKRGLITRNEARRTLAHFGITPPQGM